MDKQKQIEYWLESIEEDWKSAIEIAENNTRKHFALFIVHLSIEKLLKALYIKLNDELPPFTHNLVYLASKCRLDTEKDNLERLKIISDYNIETRYPEDKFSFYKKCTRQFVTNEITEAEKVKE